MAQLPDSNSNDCLGMLSGAEPRRGGLEAPEVRGAKERVLPEPARTEPRVAQSQGAAQAQGACHLWLHQTAGILRLDVRAGISKGVGPCPMTDPHATAPLQWP